MRFERKLQLVLEGLNDKFWDDGHSIHSEIREKLLQIAKDFADQHFIPDESIEDIILTGSMAGHNWTQFSDADVHIVVDFDKINNDSEIVRDYFRLAKALWSNTHDIEICGHEVEIYVQDASEPHHSVGIYSLIDGMWVEEPEEYQGEKPPQEDIEAKADSIIDRIEDLESQMGNGDDVSEAAERLKDKLKKMRQAGLDEEGEYSLENQTYKFLRNNGYLMKLRDLQKRSYDDSASICPTIGESEGNHEPTVIQPMDIHQPETPPPTVDPDDTPKMTPQDVIDAFHTREQMQQDRDHAMPPEEKLRAAMERAKGAENIAFQSYQMISSVNLKLDNAVRELKDMLRRISAGEPPEIEYPPDETVDYG